VYAPARQGDRLLRGRSLAAEVFAENNPRLPPRLALHRRCWRARL